MILTAAHFRIIRAIRDHHPTELRFVSNATIGIVVITTNEILLSWRDEWHRNARRDPLDIAFRELEIHQVIVGHRFGPHAQLVIDEDRLMEHAL